VIIVTGPGRSGTSVLAQLYQQLGFDPGGQWIPSVNAGFEHGDFWRLNNKLARDVGSTMLKLRPPPPSAESASESASDPAVDGGGEAPKRKGNPNGRLRMIDWDRVPAVIAEYGEEMVRLSKQTPFVKDPRFTWTLPLWIAAGAEIEHVTITTRAMDDMIASRHAAGHSRFNAVELRNNFTYGLGVVSAAVADSGLSHSFIRFPDFLRDLDGLYAALRFPSPIAIEHFRTVAERVFDRGQVHWSDGQPSA
jgi:hypothetical protein